MTDFAASLETAARVAGYDDHARALALRCLDLCHLRRPAFTVTPERITLFTRGGVALHIRRVGRECHYFSQLPRTTRCSLLLAHGACAHGHADVCPVWLTQQNTV